MIRVVVLILLSACLPQVGPAVDASVGGGGEVAGGGVGGGGALNGGGAGGGSASVDGGSDAGARCDDRVLNGTESDVDCGGDCAPCANTAACRTALDCESGLCSAGHCAAPSGLCGSAFASCVSFTDLTGQAATVHFPSGGENVYSPRCLKVRFGQSVTFSGDFSSHPMQGACGPAPSGLRATSGSTLTVTFDQALGTFGYYCTQHGSSGGSGMAGAVEVVR